MWGIYMSNTPSPTLFVKEPLVCIHLRLKLLWVNESYSRFLLILNIGCTDKQFYFKWFKFSVSSWLIGALFSCEPLTGQSYTVGHGTKVKIKRLFLNCCCLLVPRLVTAGHVRDSQNCKSITMEMDCLCPVMLWGLQGWASLQQTFVFAWTLVRKHTGPEKVFMCCL